MKTNNTANCKFYVFLACILTILSPVNLHAQKSITIAINTDISIAKLQSNMWGVFFEDINFGADGGLYAELIKNRKGKIDVDMISLLPDYTWKNRSQRLRADMVKMLADMKPGFVRFPGGCIAKGTDLANRYQWKKTIGPIENGQLIMNRWNVEFANRPAPDFYQSFGVDFYEYRQLAEDIGSEVLPILNCAKSYQFNTAKVTSIDELDPLCARCARLDGICKRRYQYKIEKKWVLTSAIQNHLT